MNATIAVLKTIADANGGIVTTEEALRAGTNRVTLKRYADKGVLTRIARGQYTMTGFVPDEFTLFAKRKRESCLLLRQCHVLLGTVRPNATHF